MKVQVKAKRCGICNAIVPKNSENIKKILIPKLIDNDVVENALLKYDTVSLCNQCRKMLKREGHPTWIVYETTERHGVYYDGFLFWPYEEYLDNKSPKAVLVPPEWIVLLRDDSGRYHVEGIDLDEIEDTVFQSYSYNIAVKIRNVLGYVPKSYYDCLDDYLTNHSVKHKPIPDVYKRILDFISNTVYQEV